MTAPNLFLLDTNVLVHYVRASPLWVHIRETYQLLTVTPGPLISVITEGEMRSLALQRDWGPKKLDQMEFFLSFLQSQTIDNPAVIRAYAAIDAYCEEIGQPLGKNDVWIAATAAVTGARLLTTDRDFDRLTPRFLNRDWIDPSATAGT